jgi:hypothetical protein
MTQLLFIEVFVFGASLIASVYHFVLFIQQKGKFLLFYSIYLFSTSLYLNFKLYSNNYNPFEPTANNWYYATEEILQVIMYSSYATFAAVTLEVTKKPLIVKWCWIGLLIFSAITIVVHLSKAFIIGPGITHPNSVWHLQVYCHFNCRLCIGYGMAGADFCFPKNDHHRFLCVCVLCHVFCILFFIFNKNYFGLSGVEPYLIGSFIDIIIFSGALGYRFKKIADEKTNYYNCHWLQQKAEQILQNR